MAGVVRPYAPAADEPWASEFLDEHLGGRRQARWGEVIDVLGPGLGFVTSDRTGLLTYRVDGDALELTALAAEPRGSGSGTLLVQAFVAEAAVRGATKLWVVTTNDNLDAITFYEHRGFRVTTVRAGAIDEARRTLKPTIPLVGDHGIEMHDEIELAMTVPVVSP